MSHAAFDLAFFVAAYTLPQAGQAAEAGASISAFDVT